MPRTKAARKKVAAKPLAQHFTEAIELIEANRKQIHLKYDQKCEDFLAKLMKDLNKQKLSFPPHLMNKTFGELEALPLNWSGNTTNASVMHILDATKSSMTERKKPVTRSSSFAEDEGYLTAESSNRTSGGRQSRTRSKLQKSTRVSRSLSSRQKKLTATVDRFKTPSNKVPPSSYATVTPKMKPNVPQVLLRRPKQGEVALSMQGSPLCTGPVSTEEVANINIPLDGGERIFTLKPLRGLRVSQIPFLDSKTKRDIETLRDNLNIMCALSNNQ